MIIFINELLSHNSTIITFTGFTHFLKPPRVTVIPINFWVRSPESAQCGGEKKKKCFGLVNGSTTAGSNLFVLSVMPRKC